MVTTITENRQPAKNGADELGACLEATGADGVA